MQIRESTFLETNWCVHLSHYGFIPAGSVGMDGKRRIVATFEQYGVYYESQMLNGIIKKEAYRWIKRILKAFLARKNRFQVELDRSEAGKELKVMANCVEHL